MPTPVKDIRNVAIVGHTGSGKTMLCETMLFAMGAIKAVGSVEKGTTVSDWDPLEKDRGGSIETAVLHGLWQKKDINLLDAPGALDFVGAAISALSAAQCAVLTIHATNGIEVTTRQMWDLAQKRNMPTIIVVSRMDSENTIYEKIMSDLKAFAGGALASVTVPQGAGADFKGVVNLLAENVPAEFEKEKTQLIENIVSGDDALMMRYMDGAKISPEELAGAATKALKSRALIPVFTLASLKNIGVKDLLDFIAQFAPSPEGGKYTVLVGKDNEEREVDGRPDGPLVAQCFKVMSDEYRRIALFRVLSGSAKAGAAFKIVGKGSSRITAFLRLQGKAAEEIIEAGYGEILGVTKVDELGVGDTLSNEENKVKPFTFPKPMVELAVFPAKHGEESKLGDAFRKLSSADPTFRAEFRASTHQTVMAGMGSVHLEVIKKRLGLEILCRQPKIPYLETITRSVQEVKYRHKKQTGGSGQFGEVVINVSPNVRGGGYEWSNDIHGMAVSGMFAESANKGIGKKLEEGIIAGYPVVDIKVSLVDGKEHPVDSKDIAFQIAGREAIKEAVSRAGPAILEPWVTLEVNVPTRFIGDIMADLPGRRGQIKGTDTVGDMAIISAIVPQAEVRDYSNQLRSITAGEGTYAMEFSHYDLVPGNIQQGIIAEAAREKEAEKAR
jgi:elongation factor G